MLVVGRRCTHQMDSSRDKTPLRELRLSSLAGKGMPERIRNFGFAFLGLTAAAGLAVVAIFAQMGFPLLSPSPLPSAPPEPNSISKATALNEGSPAVGPALSRGAVVASSLGAGRGDSTAGPRRGDGSRVDNSADPVAGSVAGNGSGSTQPSEPAGNPAPAPSPVPAQPASEPAPVPVETPVASPETGSKPDRSTPISTNPDKPKAQPAATKPPKPEAKPAKPVKPSKGKPAKPSKPATPEPKPAKTAATPAPEPVYAPAPSSAPEGKEKLQVADDEDSKGK